MTVRTVVLTIEYDGTGLSGWQRQANAPTVQQHLERAVAAMTGARAEVVGASRTDAGVHARGQVAHFRTKSEIPLHGFVRGINTHVPRSIAVIDAREGTPDFHARHHSAGKHYRYALFTRPVASPLTRRWAWHRPGRHDIDAMRHAAMALVGEHDFTSFRAAGCQAKTPHRRIKSITISENINNYIYINVFGDAFLRNMVRIVAGTLDAVGQGRMAAANIPAVLTARDRTAAGPTAPAHGLTLVRVYYGRADYPGDGPREWGVGASGDPV